MKWFIRLAVPLTLVSIYIEFGRTAMLIAAGIGFSIGILMILFGIMLLAARR